MEQYIYWKTATRLIEENKILEAEKYGTEIAKKLEVSQELIDKIFSVNLKSYEKKIDSLMGDCLEKAHKEKAKALCLYYSIDNGWDSTMYICKDYSDDDNKWISNSRNWVEIGKARGFSGIYKKNAESSFFADNLSSGICILLMLRTTIAFYNVASKYKDCGFKLCITGTESDFVRIV